jgi:hypothetical protein
VTAAGDRHLGLLVVRMGPTALDEEEFNAWYDFEHLPQRLALPGFLSGERYVCLQGAPKYVAIYDLADTEVITGRDYLAEAGQHFTPWSKRMLARVGSVWTRLDLEQIYPGTVQRHPDWHGAALYEFGEVDAASLVQCAEQINASEPLIQARAFTGVFNIDRPAALLMLEAPAWRLLPTWSGAELATRLGPIATTLRSFHLYTRYWRSDIVGTLIRPGHA